MAQIISTIDQLKETAKVNKTFPFEAVSPFLTDARELYLAPYMGEKLLELLEQENVPEHAKVLLEKTRRCLGPLALWLGNAELSVRIGDSGFTVAKRESGTSGEGYVPASDTKIEKVEESLERRAFAYLDLILEYLEENADSFPEWKNSRYYTLRSGTYIRSAKEFQEIGLVDINYSRLAFEHFRPVMGMIEVRIIGAILGEELDKRLREKLSNDPSSIEQRLIVNIQRYVACKTAEIHTSEKSKDNRRKSREREYKPVIRPIYQDPEYTGNYFADQCDFYLSKIDNILEEFGDDLGFSYKSPALNFNDEDKSIFVDIG